MRRHRDAEAPPDAYHTALTLLRARDWSAQALRAALRRRGCPSGEIETALDTLRSTGVLDDSRVAEAKARVLAERKGRGPLRVRRELEALGIPHDVAGRATAAAFGEVDEAASIDRAITRRLRGRRPDLAGLARIHRQVVALGFDPAKVRAALKRVAPGIEPED